VEPEMCLILPPVATGQGRKRQRQSVEPSPQAIELFLDLRSLGWRHGRWLELAEPKRHRHILSTIAHPPYSGSEREAEHDKQAGGEHPPAGSDRRHFGRGPVFLINPIAFAKIHSHRSKYARILRSYPRLKVNLHYSGKACYVAGNRVRWSRSCDSDQGGSAPSTPRESR